MASLPPTTLYVASRWETVDAGNQHYLEELEKTGATIVDCWAIHTLPGRPKGKNFKKCVELEKSEVGGIEQNYDIISNNDVDSSSRLPATENKEIYSAPYNRKKYKLQPHLRLCIGARVQLTINVCTDLGLVNGALGTVVGFLYIDNNRTDSSDNSGLPFYACNKIVPECPNLEDASVLQPSLPIVLVQIDQILPNLICLFSSTKCRFSRTDNDAFSMEQ